MPSFEELFVNAIRNEKRAVIQYKGETLYRLDRISLASSTRIEVTILATNSEWRQNVHIKSDVPMCERGESGKNMVFWEDPVPCTYDVEFLVKRKKPTLCVYNGWGYEDGSHTSLVHGAAMKIVFGENERTYYCNDGHPDDDFDDLVFKISGIY